MPAKTLYFNDETVSLMEAARAALLDRDGVTWPESTVVRLALAALIEKLTRED